MKKSLFAALVCLTTSAFAGDVARLTNIGFSADGKSFAFMESGTYDGLGNSYANVRFIDVASNKYAATSVEHVEYEEDAVSPEVFKSRDVIEQEALAKAKETLDKLGIKSNIRGELRASRKISDIEASKLTTVTFTTGDIFHVEAAPSYKLAISVSNVAKPAGVTCISEMPNATKKMKLTLTSLSSKKTVVLQEDKSLPASRGCVNNYVIEDVLVKHSSELDSQAGSVVVMIRKTVEDFEGPSIRYMAVSGNLIK